MTPTNAALQQRIAELEAENVELRQAAATPLKVPRERPAEARERTGFRARSRWWTVLATVLVLIGVILAPVSVVASWARVSLTDTERFVGTFAPLAKDAAVQEFITDKTMEVITERVDIEQLTSDILDGVTKLGTGPKATAAIEALKGPAAEGIRSLLESRIAAFVQSETFADVWATALRVTHRQTVAALANDPDAAVELGGDGTIGVQLGPIIEAAKTALVDQGIGIASGIPEVDRTITIARSDAIPTIQLAYGAAVAAGTWLPWLSLGFLAAGVLVARRKSVALVATAASLALMMIIVAIGFAVGRALFITSVSPGLVPTGVATRLFDAVADGMRSTTTAVITLALVVALVAVLAGPFATPRKLRAAARSTAAGIREFGARRGLTTGRAGEWIYRQRVLVRVVIVVAAAAVVVFVRPLTVPLILWTFVIAALVLAIIEVLQRPPTDAERAAPVEETGAEDEALLIS